MQETIKTLLWMVVFAMISPVGKADVWEFHRDGKVIHHQERDYRKRPAPRVALQKGGAPWLAKQRKAFDPLIQLVGSEYDVDPELIHAVIEVESAYQKGAVSSAGAVGLMQLMPQTQARYGVSDATDPVQNITAGTRYLRELLKRYDEMELVLAAYNAGEAAVARYGDSVPPFSETQQYVRKVMKRLRN